MIHVTRMATLARLQEIARAMKNENTICNSARERINSPDGSLNSMPEVKKTNLAYLKVQETELERSTKLYLSELKSFAEKEGIRFDVSVLGIVEAHSNL